MLYNSTNIESIVATFVTLAIPWKMLQAWEVWNMGFKSGHFSCRFKDVTKQLKGWNDAVLQLGKYKLQIAKAFVKKGTTPCIMQITSMSVTISRQPHTRTDQTLEHPNFWASLLTGESPRCQSFGIPQLKKDQGTDEIKISFLEQWLNKNTLKFLRHFTRI